MKYIQLGKSDLRVSQLGYGAWALGKKGWPDVDEKEAVKTLEKCLNHGINFFDTAPVYGFGRSEEQLGEVLSSVRKDVIIATKCGLRWDERGRVFHDLMPDAIQKELDASLKRLKTDYIDLYQIHWPDKRTPLEQTMEALNIFKQQGVIRHIGVSNFTVELLKQAQSLSEIVSAQNLYNIAQRDAEKEILPYCREQGIGFICYSPLAQGILAGKFSGDFKPGRHDIRRLNPLYKNKEKIKECLTVTNMLSDTPSLHALNFLVQQNGVSSILISMTRRTHLLENLKAFD